jgi:hypothetical protein
MRKTPYELTDIIITVKYPTLALLIVAVALLNSD